MKSKEELSKEEMEQIIGGGHGGYYTKTYVCCMCGKECTEERRIGVYYPDGDICKDCLREKGQRRRPR